MEECFPLRRTVSSVSGTRNRRLYQFKVTLRDVSPKIWRRVQVWENYTLEQLHRVLQAAMGWENYHLYEFRVGRAAYRDPDPENEPEILNAKRAQICNVLSGVGAKLEYDYDFGDDWQHDLLLEAILLSSPQTLYPRCIGGERSCPPEDVGGIGGYEEYLEAMADPTHELREEMMNWRGPFDPEAFSIEKINRKLEKEFRLVRGRTAPKPALSTNRTLESLPAVPAFSRRKRIRIKPEETVPLELNERERGLILQHTPADDGLINRLRVVPGDGQPLVFRFTLSDLDELAGLVAAEANQNKGKKVQKELDQLLDRIQFTMDSYTDELTIN